MRVSEQRKPARPKTSRTKWLWWVVTVGCLLVAIATALWIWQFRTYTPAAVVKDLRAAIEARNAPQPAERFMELRYGPMTEPANRQKAFLDFFDLDHMEGLYRLVGRIPAGRKQTAIGGMAEWVANYRHTLSPEEKESLRTYLNSDAGRIKLRKATSEYLRKDVTYRAATAPVIKELMATLAAAQKP